MTRTDHMSYEGARVIDISSSCQLAVMNWRDVFSNFNFYLISFYRIGVLLTISFMSARNTPLRIRIEMAMYRVSILQSQDFRSTGISSQVIKAPVLSPMDSSWF